MIHFSCISIYQICTYLQDLFKHNKPGEINRLPNYLVLCFSPEFSTKTKEINQLIEYCKTIKLPRVALYDYHGNCHHSDVKCLNYQNSSKPLLYDLIKDQNEKLVNNDVIDEPDLMIVFSDILVLYQFNPLALRFCQIEHCRKMDIDFDEFKSIFYSFNNHTQRYGK